MRKRLLLLGALVLSGTALAAPGTGAGSWGIVEVSGGAGGGSTLVNTQPGATTDPSLSVGEKQFSNFEAGTVTTLQEWPTPAPGVDTEVAAIYFKLDRDSDDDDDGDADYTTNVFDYGIYAEIEAGGPAGGSAIRIVSDSTGDASYVLVRTDPSISGQGSGGVGQEVALSGNASTAFLASLQGTSGDLAVATADQKDSVLLSVLMSDDDIDENTAGFTGPMTRGAVVVENAVGNSFTARQSEYIATSARSEFRITDHEFTPLWEARGDGATLHIAEAATSGAQNQAPTGLINRMYYWDGSASQIYDFALVPSITGAPSPTPTLSFTATQYIAGSPQTSDLPLVLTEDSASFQNASVSDVGGLTMQAGQTLNTNTGSIVTGGGNLQTDGGRLYIDADDDSFVYAPSDDQIDVALGNTTEYQFTATTLSFQNNAATAVGGLTMQAGGANLDMQGGQVINTAAVTGLAASSIVFAHWRQTTQAATPTGTTQAIDWNSGNAMQLSLGSITGDVTLTLSNPGQGGIYTVTFSGNSGNYDAIWPASVKWVGGTAPQITHGASSRDLISLYWTGSEYFEYSRMVDLQ